MIPSTFCATDPRSQIDWNKPGFRNGLHILLSEVMHGEILSMETSAAMISFASSLQAKYFLAEQAAEERKHAIEFRLRLHHLGRNPAPRSAAMDRIAESFQQHVRNRSWTECLVAQNIVLEGVATVLFEALREIADPETARLLEEIQPEEEKHVQFGITSLQKVPDDSRFRERVIGTQEALLPLMAELFTSHPSIQDDCGIDYHAIADRALSHLTENLQSIGIELSVWDRARRSVWRWLH